MNKEELKADLEHYRNIVDNVLLSSKPISELKNGDVFLWRSGMDGHFEIHVFHSDSGYGAKTYTDYNTEDGSSLLVNYSGICGVLNIPHNYATSQTEALKKEIEELKKKTEWISVMDRLPKIGGRYLCYCEEQNDLGLSHFVWNCSYDETSKRFTDSMIEYFVTHWIPLPNPPKQ